MKKNFPLMMFSIFLSFCLHITLVAQNQLQQKIQQPKPPLNTPERAAMGETKWMMHNLKFDSLIFQMVYNVNLKYRIQSDSVHKLINIESSDRQKLYEKISTNKKDELKLILSPRTYNDYLSLLQDVKLKFRKN